MNLRTKSVIKKFMPNKALLLYRTHILKFIKHFKQRKLLQFEVHLADHCNLNCKNCNHFSPLSKENFMDIEDFKNDCERLGKLTNGCVKFIRFMGGEPLLHSKITDFLDIGRKYFPRGEFILVTNGLLLAKQSKAFWDCCHKNDVEIQVSNYPIKIDKDKINMLAKSHKVIIYYVGGNKKIIWTAMKLDLGGKQNISENFKICSLSNTCIHLNKGKLYTCPVVPYIKHFNDYFNQNLQVTKHDYIDIYKAKNLDEILNFLSNPVQFCRYCNIRGFKEAEWAASKKDISEWT
jgi:organic radical activating enzyme